MEQLEGFVDEDRQIMYCVQTEQEHLWFKTSCKVLEC